MAEGLTCHACGNVGFDSCNDGFYYCRRCGSQAEDIIETGVAEEDFLDVRDARAIYLAGNRRHKHHHHTVIKTEPLSQSQTHYPSIHSQSQFWKSLNSSDDHNKTIKKEEPEVEEVKPSVPYDFGFPSRDLTLSPEEYSSEVRIRYVMGIQLMIQFQCQALVETFGVSPLICGLAGMIWMRLVTTSRVFDDGWVDKVIEDSEVVQKEGESKVRKPRARYSAEPLNIHGQRAVMLWFKSLKKRIPISYSLAVSFLACHIAREAILPTDILKWALEGKLPYLTAFVDVEKCFGPPSRACPLSPSFMFRPLKAVGLHKLESLAASVARSIGLQLPPVNFHAIAQRYLKELSLPVENIFSHASRIYEWVMPLNLWLPVSEYTLPTHVCVMSILVVAIRILYNINGFGKWETSLSSLNLSSSSCDQVEKSDPTCIEKRHDNGEECSCPPNFLKMDKREVGSSSLCQKFEFDAEELLHHLGATYDKIYDFYEYSKDLPTYLKYCKDVVFAGLEPSFEDNEEEKIIEQFWDFYETQENSESPKETGIGCDSGLKRKRLKDDKGCVNTQSTESKKPRDEACNSSTSVGNREFDMDNQVTHGLDVDDCSPSPQEEKNSVPGSDSSAETLKDRALRSMKMNMEDNRFCYIAPRVNPKRFDYLHYVRKNDEGVRTYVAHADYYILLRSCAKIAQVDIRYMHFAVLRLERRLAGLEYIIDNCLHLRPPNQQDSLGS